MINHVCEILYVENVCSTPKLSFHCVILKFLISGDINHLQDFYFLNKIIINEEIHEKVFKFIFKTAFKVFLGFRFL